MTPGQKETKDRLLASGRVGDYDGLPPCQGLSRLVFFTKDDKAEYAVKLPKKPRHLPKLVRRLRYAGSLNLESAVVPKLVDYDRSPCFIMMSRLEARTLRDAWPAHYPVPEQDVRQVGTAIGSFLAEMLRKTGGVYYDLNPGNIMWTADNRLGIVDWDFGLRSPAHAMASLMAHPRNLAPYAANQFENEIGLAFDPDRVAAIARVDFGKRLPHFEPTIARNLQAWKDMFPTPEFSRSGRASQAILTARAALKRAFVRFDSGTRPA
jgi:hypothetical protein